MSGIKEQKLKSSLALKDFNISCFKGTQVRNYVLTEIKVLNSC